MAHSDAVPIMEPLLRPFAWRLTNDDSTITDLMAQTNTISWDLDDYDKLQAWFKGYGRIGFSVQLYLSGEQDEDKSFCGSKIQANVEGEASINNDDEWQISDYRIPNAAIVDA